MNAHKFVAEKGVDEAKGIISNIPAKYMECYYSTLCWCTKTKKYSDRFKPRISLVNIADLIRVVDSVELTEQKGGLGKLKKESNCLFYNGFEGIAENYEKAISDYELVESYKQVKCEVSFGIALQSNQSIGAKCEVLDMVDVSPRCEVRNG